VELVPPHQPRDLTPGFAHCHWDNRAHGQFHKPVLTTLILFGNLSFCGVATQHLFIAYFHTFSGCLGGYWRHDGDMLARIYSAA
jgi:hypothetical protein